MRTPGYGSQTPIYSGAKTPLHGNATPQYDSGSRTPHGSMTPSHDGSMTPRHNAWDPNSTSTPARSSDYDYEDPSPSPSYNSSTPYPISYAPQTPGGNMFGSEYSPLQPSPSPSPSPYQTGHMGTPSPSAYSPNTPGNSQFSPFNPQTPGAGLDSQMGDWCTTDIEVRIRSHEDADLAGQTGVIRTVNNRICSVFLPQEDRSVSIECDQLEPVSPTPGDDFKVIFGDSRDTTGKIIDIEQNNCVCKLSSGVTVYLPLRNLCKMKCD
jgi:transcription elongation factor SPT5